MSQETSSRYTVRKINLMPLARFGCVLGGLAMLLPGLICAAASTQLVGLVRFGLDRLQQAQMDLLGVAVPLDFIQLLGLETVQAFLTRLDDQWWLLALLVLLVCLVGGGLMVALTILLLGWAYNLLAALTGGLELELRQ